VKVTPLHSVAHLLAVTSEQLLPFRHCAQVLAGAAQFVSHEKLDELRLQD
jgi:hypothetical protein